MHLLRKNWLQYGGKCGILRRVDTKSDRCLFLGVPSKGNARLFAENEGKDKEKLEQWEQEHWEMLCRTAPAQFTVRHYAALAELEKK